MEMRRGCRGHVHGYQGHELGFNRPGPRPGCRGLSVLGVGDLGTSVEVSIPKHRVLIQVPIFSYILENYFHIIKKEIIFLNLSKDFFVD